MKPLCRLVLLLALLPVTAAAVSSDRQLQVFAGCAGRLSAVMEHQWMFDPHGSEATQAQRAAMLQIIAAIQTPDQGRAVLSWRIAAKQAHAALLTRATFNDDSDDAAWASQTATRLQESCTALLTH